MTRYLSVFALFFALFVAGCEDNGDVNEGEYEEASADYSS